MGAEKAWCRGVDLIDPVDVCHVHVGKRYSEEFELKAGYFARCSSSLCLKPCHVSCTLSSSGKTSMLTTLLASLNRSRKVSGGA